MPSDDHEEHRDAFGLFDKLGDGKVESRELGDILRALGCNPTEAEVKKIIADIDPTGNKRISFEEFIPLLSTQGKKSATVSYEHFAEGFRVFDRDNNGTVSVAEVRHLLISLGEKLTDSEVDTLVGNMEDKNGCLNYEEFIRSVMNG